MTREILVVALLTWAVPSPAAARAEDPASLLTQGKLDADMGRHAAAATAFEAVANDPAAPAASRWEALVRLGLVRRAAGDLKGAAKAYERVWMEYRQDKEALRFLVLAVAGSVPGHERWDAIWQTVILKVDGAKTDRPVLRVEWPGVPSGPRTYTGSPVTLDLKDGPLNDVFRLIADVTQLNVVVHPGVRGTVTMQVRDVPWDEALDRALAPNGLAASQVGRILEIGRPERLPAPRRFEGAPIDVDYKDLDLHEALRRVVPNGGPELSIDPVVAGKMTIRLEQVPWDQAFDLLVRVNGLAWKQEGTRIRVGPPADLR